MFTSMEKLIGITQPYRNLWRIGAVDVPSWNCASLTSRKTFSNFAIVPYSIGAMQNLYNANVRKKWW